MAPALPTPTSASPDGGPAPSLEQVRAGLREDVERALEALAGRLEASQAELVGQQTRQLLQAVSRLDGPATSPKKGWQRRPDLNASPKGAAQPGGAAALVETRSGDPAPPVGGVASSPKGAGRPDRVVAPVEPQSGDLCAALSPEPEPAATSGGPGGAGSSGAPPRRVSAKRNQRRATSTESAFDVIGVDVAANNLGSITRMRTSLGRHWIIVQILKTVRAFHACIAMEYPNRGRMIDRLVEDGRFKAFCSLVILLNAAFIIQSTDSVLRSALEGVESDDGIASYLEYAFIGWYFIELLLKIAAFGIYICAGPDWYWNTFDLILVLASVIQVALEVALESINSGGQKLAFLRGIKVLKISRALRLFRFIEHLKDMRLMLDSMMRSLIKVFWGLVLVVCLDFIFAIVILQLLILSLGAQEEAHDDALIEMFGSVSQTMLVLYQAISSGREWREPYDELMKHGAVPSAMVLMAFVSFIILAVWNILTSIFVESVIQMAVPDQETQGLMKRRADIRDADELRRILEELDVDCSGTLTPEEFEGICQEAKFRMFLESHDLRIKDAKMFFGMVSQCSGEGAAVDIETMLACCLHIKGMATALDLSIMRFEVNSALAQQRKVLRRLVHQAPPAPPLAELAP